MFDSEILFSPLLLLGLLGLLAVAYTAAPLIPVRQRTRTSVPVVTLSLILLNVFVFVFTSEGGQIQAEVAQSWGLIPRSASLITLLTSVFLHSSWWHLFFNLLGLYLFGTHVEEALGRLEFLLFFIGCGLAAGLLHVIMAATLLPAAYGVPMVGASGALFGILGLFAVRFYRDRVRVLVVAQVPAIWAVGGFALLQVVYGILSVSDGGRSDNTANWAHVGGFLFGMLIAVPLRMREEGKREYRLEDAETAVSAGRLDQAAAFYRLSLTEKPDDAETHRQLARVCVRMAQGEAAHRHYLDALRLLLRANEAPAVSDVYEEACRSFETFPLPPALLYRVAGACEAAHKFPLALHALSEVCRCHKNSAEAEISLLRMGKLHLQRLSQPRSAHAIFAEFVRLYPESEWRSHALRLLCEAREAQGYEPVPAPQG